MTTRFPSRLTVDAVGIAFSLRVDLILWRHSSAEHRIQRRLRGEVKTDESLGICSPFTQRGKCEQGPHPFTRDILWGTSERLDWTEIGLQSLSPMWLFRAGFLGCSFAIAARLCTFSGWSDSLKSISGTTLRLGFILWLRLVDSSALSSEAILVKQS